jgi:hypothetical protein
MSVSKIQSGHFSPKSPALAVSSKHHHLSKNLCGQWAGHSLQNAHLPTGKTFGMKSQKEGGFGPPRAVTPWKKKNICTCIYLGLWIRELCTYIMFKKYRLVCSLFLFYWHLFFWTLTHAFIEWSVRPGKTFWLLQVNLIVKGLFTWCQ